MILSPASSSTSFVLWTGPLNTRRNNVHSFVCKCVRVSVCELGLFFFFYYFIITIYLDFIYACRDMVYIFQAQVDELQAFPKALL